MLHTSRLQILRLPAPSAHAAGSPLRMLGCRWARAAGGPAPTQRACPAATCRDCPLVAADGALAKQYLRDNGAGEDKSVIKEAYQSYPHPENDYDPSRGDALEVGTPSLAKEGQWWCGWVCGRGGSGGARGAGAACGGGGGASGGGPSGGRRTSLRRLIKGLPGKGDRAKAVATGYARSSCDCPVVCRAVACCTHYAWPGSVPLCLSAPLQTLFAWLYSRIPHTRDLAVDSPGASQQRHGKRGSRKEAATSM